MEHKKPLHFIMDNTNNGEANGALQPTTTTMVILFPVPEQGRGLVV